MAKTSDTDDIYQQKDIPNHDKTANFLAEPLTGCYVDWFVGYPLNVTGTCYRPHEQYGICDINTTRSRACDPSDSLLVGTFTCVGVNNWRPLVLCNFTREQILYKCYIIFHGQYISEFLMDLHETLIN